MIEPISVVVESEFTPGREAEVSGLHSPNSSEFLYVAIRDTDVQSDNQFVNVILSEDGARRIRDLLNELLGLL